MYDGHFDEGISRTVIGIIDVGFEVFHEAHNVVVALWRGVDDCTGLGVFQCGAWYFTIAGVGRLKNGVYLLDASGGKEFVFANEGVAIAQGGGVVGYFFGGRACFVIFKGSCTIEIIVL